MEKTFTERLTILSQELLEGIHATIVEDLLKSYELDRDEVSGIIRNSITSSGMPLTPKLKSKSQLSSQTFSTPQPPKSRKKAASSTITTETCVGMLQKKNEICGKKATTEIDGSFYCGIHARSANKTAEKPATQTTKKDKKPSTKESKPRQKKKEEFAIPSKSKSTLVENKKKSEDKLKVLLQKAIPSVLKLVTIGDRKMDENTRILFEGRRAYGKLDIDDLELINPLSEEDIEFLEKHGIEQCTIPMKSSQNPDIYLDEEETELNLEGDSQGLVLEEENTLEETELVEDPVEEEIKPEEEIEEKEEEELVMELDEEED